MVKKAAPEMPPRSRKVSAAALNRIAELARQGWTQEAIAIQLKQEGLADITQQLVAKKLADLEDAGAKLNRRKRNDHRNAPGDRLAAPPPAAEPGAAAPPAATGEPRPPRTIADEIERVRERLDEIGAMITAAKENGNTTNFGQLVRIEAGLVKDLQSLIPPAPHDPEKDPMHVESKRKLLAFIERLVGVAERAGGPETGSAAA